MVTSVDFYPEEECYFLTGSMDKKLRVWSIPQGCVVKWIQAPSIITTVTFCPGGLSSRCMSRRETLCSRIE